MTDSWRIAIITSNGARYPSVSFRDYPWAPSDAAVAKECSTSGTCYMSQNGALVPNVFTGTAYSNALLGLDSAQRALQVYHNVMQDGEIKIEYPTDNPNVSGGSAASRFLIEYNGTAPNITWGSSVTHEIGHLVQMMMFDQDGLINDCSAFGSGHQLNSIEFNSCATAEGWADYVAAVSWWDPGNSQSIPVLWGWDFEEEDPELALGCWWNSLLEGQVARAFWDLDDVRNSPTEPVGKLDLDGDGTRETFVDADGDGVTDKDVANLSTLSIAEGWDNFPNGQANRQDYEGGFSNGFYGDSNGVNVRDYDANFNVNNQTFLNHNCVLDQAND